MAAASLGPDLPPQEMRPDKRMLDQAPHPLPMPATQQPFPDSFPESQPQLPEQHARAAMLPGQQGQVAAPHAPPPGASRPPPQPLQPQQAAPASTGASPAHQAHPLQVQAGTVRLGGSSNLISTPLESLLHSPAQGPGLHSDPQAWSAGLIRSSSSDHHQIISAAAARLGSAAAQGLSAAPGRLQRVQVLGRQLAHGPRAGSEALAPAAARWGWQPGRGPVSLVSACAAACVPVQCGPGGAWALRGAGPACCPATRLPDCRAAGWGPCKDHLKAWP